AARCCGRRTSRASRYVVAGVRQDDVGEDVEERPPRVVEGAVLDHVDGAVGGERRVDEWVRRAGDGTQLDGDYVVGQAPPVGEPGEVAAQQAQAVRHGGGRDGDVEPQLVGPGGPGEVLEPGDQAGRYAGQEDGQEVGAVLVQRRQVGEHARVQDRQQRRQL